MSESNELRANSPVKSDGSNYDKLDIFKAYEKSPYLSIKHSTYFEVYKDLFERYRGQKIKFVEIGVLNGGSLFMWRDYLGPQAQIIGIDLNPSAKKWEKEGFQIHIGSQSDPKFWDEFFSEVGNVDVVLDDGGHTYEQQIVTVHHSIPHINDGGLVVVEDTHTSYFRDFGYPTRYSFVNWVKTLLDEVSCRCPSVHRTTSKWYKDFVYSVSMYESIVSISIDRKKCVQSSPTSNHGKSMDAVDFRYSGSRVNSFVVRSRSLSARFKNLKEVPGVRDCYYLMMNLFARINMRKLKRYF